jgi:hypothetical protein
LAGSPFPEGLKFTHVRVGKREPWRIQGVADPFVAYEVTPPGHALN